jgi:hypothetical protein
MIPALCASLPPLTCSFTSKFCDFTDAEKHPLGLRVAVAYSAEIAIVIEP